MHDVKPMKQRFWCDSGVNTYVTIQSVSCWPLFFGVYLTRIIVASDKLVIVLVSIEHCNSNDNMVDGLVMNHGCRRRPRNR